MKFRPVIESGQLKVENAFITRDNINGLIRNAGISGEIDLLSIDIEGNDYYVWEAVDVISPRVVIIEYNGKFPPDIDWKMAYNEVHIWDGSDWHGASLKALELLGRRLGYQLVGTNLIGANAFFVRKDLTGNQFLAPATAETLYNPLRLQLHFAANHPAGYCLKGQKDGLGKLNYQDYELVSGFHTVEETAVGKCVWTSKPDSLLRVLLKQDCHAVEIPYWIAPEIVENASYSVEVCVNQKYREVYILTEEKGSFQIVASDVLRVGDVCEIGFHTQHMWRPCDVLGTADQREIGIYLELSGIQMLN